LDEYAKEFTSVMSGVFTFRKSWVLDNTSDKRTMVNYGFEHFYPTSLPQKKKTYEITMLCFSVHPSQFPIWKHIVDFHKICVDVMPIEAAPTP
jgi:hypothetical protein